MSIARCNGFNFPSGAEGNTETIVKYLIQTHFKANDGSKTVRVYVFMRVLMSSQAVHSARVMEMWIFSSSIPSLNRESHCGVDTGPF